MATTTTITTSVNAASGALFTKVDDLVGNIVVQFRPALRTLLLELNEKAAKASHAQQALISFRKHQNAGSFPPAINSLRIPVCQISKEFEQIGQGKTFLAEIDSRVKDAKVKSLEAFIETKEKELAFLREEFLTSEEMVKRFKLVTSQTLLSLVEMFGGAENLPSSITKDKNELDNLAAWYTGRAVQIAYAAHHSVVQNRLRKISLKESTDTDMADVDTRTIEKAVEIALQKQKKAGATNQKRKANSGTSDLYHLPCISAHTSRQKSSSKKEEDGTNSWGEENLSSTSQTKRRRTETTAEVQEMMDSRPWNFHIKNGASYPDSFLCVSPKARLMFSIINSDIQWLNAKRHFSPGVHKHPDVRLPHNVEYMLSLNLKHVFHREPTLSLPFQAFRAFERSVRLKWFFRNKENNNKDLKFYVRTGWEPPTAAPHIEAGLAAGKEELFSQVPQIVPRDKHYLNQERIQDRLSVVPARDFLVEHEYLCLITDKNLGIAVVTLDWYSSQIRQHLSEGPYQRREVPFESIRETVGHAIHCTLVYDNDWTDFMDETKAHCSVPEFYGIPKIHKNPWKIRPIVPCHSWYTTNTGKIIDHLLQPLLPRLFPWVLTSSKTLCAKVEELKSTYINHPFLAIGDVKSMYTNIPQLGITAVLREIKDEFPDLLPLSHWDDLYSLVRFVNHNCYFSVFGETYWQSDGLAMGSPCAPTLANIYLGWYERKVSHITGEVGYFRYIDDILYVADHATQEIPHDLCQRVNAPGLEIEWSWSNRSVNFLDLSLSVRGSVLCTSLFQKDLNHYQYIPWSSAHPRYMLRAFVKAELLRFLRTSSFQSDFNVARQSFWHHLVVRGYPIPVLRKWFKMVTWSSRPSSLLPGTCVV